jgi:hypothetical protein
MKIDVKEGDIIFRRAANGWIVERPIECYTEDHNHATESLMETIVVEESEQPTMPDPDGDSLWRHVTVPDAESLSRALWEAFDTYYQSKHHGGIVVEYRDKGKEDENNKS